MEKLVSLVMGSRSDWRVMEVASSVLLRLEVPFESRVVSAHRTPHRLVAYGEEARARGIQVIIAAAGGAAHLAGMMAALTPLPVLGVPIKTDFCDGMDSLLSMVQMPKGIPVGTLAVGEWGAHNAALLAVEIVALNDEHLAKRYDEWRAQQTNDVPLLPHD